MKKKSKKGERKEQLKNNKRKNFLKKNNKNYWINDFVKEKIIYISL
jgi:hypothetical protein